MGKARDRTARKPGAIGNDGLSKYARRVRQREVLVLESPPVPVRMTPQSGSRQRIFAILPGFSITQKFVFALAEDGRQLFVPMHVIRNTKLKIRAGYRIECETVHTDGERLPRVTNIFSSVPPRG